MLPAQPATNDKDWGWQSGSSGNSACLAWVLIMAQPFKQMKDGVCSNLRPAGFSGEVFPVWPG
jgi:hypothetical protein